MINKMRGKYIFQGKKAILVTHTILFLIKVLDCTEGEAGLLEKLFLSMMYIKGTYCLAEE